MRDRSSGLTTAAAEEVPDGFERISVRGTVGTPEGTRGNGCAAAEA
jgi:hypothetical protein